MILVNHVVPGRQLCKGSDSLAALLRLFSLPAALLSEDIRFGQHGKLHQRIFVSPVRIAVGDHNLSALQDAVFIFRIECRHSVVCQVPRKTLSAGSRRTQKDNPVFLPSVNLQILDQKGEVAVVDTAAGRMDVKLCRYLVRTAHFRLRGHTDQAALLQPVFDLSAGEQHIHLSGKDVSLLQTVRHAVPEFFFYRFRIFFCFLRLVQEKGCPLREIVKK